MWEDVREMAEEKEKCRVRPGHSVWCEPLGTPMYVSEYDGTDPVFESEAAYVCGRQSGPVSKPFGVVYTSQGGRRPTEDLGLPRNPSMLSISIYHHGVCECDGGVSNCGCHCAGMQHMLDVGFIAQRMIMTITNRHA